MTAFANFLRIVLVGCAGLGTATATRGADVAVDLELVLAVDISRSMDPDEQRLQRNGYIAALRHPEVIEVIRSGGYGRIALTYVEWAGRGINRVVVPWRVIDGKDAAEGFVTELAAASFASAMRTSISDALEFSATLFAGNGFEGLRRVIDVSGDGPNNNGIPVPDARDRVVAQGITVNGLPLILKTGGALGFFDIPDLDVYYENCVIGGFGAFIVPAHSLDEFPAAIRRKMVLEIAGAPPRVMLAQHVLRKQSYDCLVGEKRWQMWIDEGGWGDL